MRQVTTGISTVFRWANMDTIKPPKGGKWRFATRGNEGNPDAAWKEGRQPTLCGTVPPRALDASVLRNELVRQGVYI